MGRKNKNVRYRRASRAAQRAAGGRKPRRTKPAKITVYTSEARVDPLDY